MSTKFRSSLKIIKKQTKIRISREKFSILLQFCFKFMSILCSLALICTFFKNFINLIDVYFILSRSNKMTNFNFVFYLKQMHRICKQLMKLPIAFPNCGNCSQCVLKNHRIYRYVFESVWWQATVLKHNSPITTMTHYGFEAEFLRNICRV